MDTREPGEEEPFRLNLIQIKCLDILESGETGKKIPATQLAAQIGSSAARVRAELSELVRQQVIEPRSCRLTERGRELFESHQKKREEIIRWLGNGNISRDQADRLLLEVGAETLQSIYALNLYRRSMEAQDSLGRILEDSDLTDILEPGEYEFSLCLTDRRHPQGGGYAGIAVQTGWFERNVRLLVRKGESSLTLRFTEPGRELLSVSCFIHGRKKTILPKDGCVSVPTEDLRIHYVKNFSILEGELELVLRTRRTENGENITEEFPVGLMVTPGYYGNADEVSVFMDMSEQGKET